MSVGARIVSSTGFGVLLQFLLSHPDFAIAWPVIIVVLALSTLWAFYWPRKRKLRQYPPNRLDARTTILPVLYPVIVFMAYHWLPKGADNAVSFALAIIFAVVGACAAWYMLGFYNWRAIPSARYNTTSVMGIKGDGAPLAGSEFTGEHAARLACAALSDCEAIPGRYQIQQEQFVNLLQSTGYPPEVATTGLQEALKKQWAVPFRERQRNGAYIQWVGLTDEGLAAIQA
ncbi:hypothetical protein [Corynebacterium heidelbergense]|uniref:Uncharacterized protein n=1 Tax=Corynebacterium heidelbergense TaxID=2055947 RepID=A0A364VDC1_9CORY|nr:hypothetical protein [Corynebacterium heidelbergense]RAV34649.1 hypothetical protein CWC39_02295 [Corynebacterium heidelbergense]